MNHLHDEILTFCHTHADHDKALGMKAYMKGQFEYFGISAPLRKAYVKTFKKKHTLTLDEHLICLIYKLWSDPHRECQYIAMDILSLFSNSLNATHIPLLEALVTNKSWWDTVDLIACNMVGKVFLHDLTCRDQYIYTWIESQNMWLNRTAIIFQLKHKEATDWDIIRDAIITHEQSKEFFIRKAQGWALRQYSRIAPIKVIDFVESHPALSGLTKREATRLIKK
ncbi:MAG: DNA alkylation repair protein [Saprospiraceae bacterium]